MRSWKRKEEEGSGRIREEGRIGEGVRMEGKREEEEGKRGETLEERGKRSRCRERLLWSRMPIRTANEG